MSTCDWYLNNDSQVITKIVRVGSESQNELIILRSLQSAGIPLFTKLVGYQYCFHYFQNTEISDGSAIKFQLQYAGDTLSSWLQKKAPIVNFKSIIGNICIAVDYLTTMNIVHNDLNVSNICIKYRNDMSGIINYNDKHFIETFNEIPVLIDFGYSFKGKTNGTHDINKLVSNFIKYEKGRKVYRNFLNNL
ncbi:MAG: hypothetical protein CL728_04900, partial [Chloroflexi bacterium]|nr:hypothetical protein [Chloroflexota bacterium]